LTQEAFVASKKKAVVPPPRTWDGMTEDEQYEEVLKMAAAFVEELSADETDIDNPEARTA